MKALIFLLFSLSSFCFAAVENNVSAAMSLSQPFVIQENDGRLTGIYQEYLSEVGKLAGLEVSFKIMPMGRILNHALKGTFDFFIFASGTPEAQKNYIEVAPFHRIHITMISTDKKLNLAKKGLTIGKPIDQFCPMIHKEHVKNVNLFEYQDTEQAMKMLMAKRMDAVCISREIFYYELPKTPYAKSKLYELPEYQYEFVISLFVNKKLSAQRVKSITRAVLELEQKKTIPSLYKKYGITNPIVL